jgi:hypothetical protein
MLVFEDPNSGDKAIRNTAFGIGLELRAGKIILVLRKELRNLILQTYMGRKGG